MKWSLRDWVYIAVFGALWGVVEVGLGSYLHVIFPSLGNTFFTGLTLAALGIMLALVGRSFVPHRGAVLMIAVITALLKLLSPGGVKLGPMLAIVAEGLLMELGLLWRGGKVRPAYALAGALALAWNAVHPLIMLPVLFGRTLAESWTKIAKDGSAILGLDASQALLILGLLLVIRWAIGAAAGWLAWDIARAARRRAG